MEEIIPFFVRYTGLSPGVIKGIGVALLLLVLLYGKNHVRGLMKFVVILVLFLALGYFAYHLVQIGMEKGRQTEEGLPPPMTNE